MAEGQELPRGSGIFFRWICAEMQSGAFWDTILRNVTVCALTSSRLDDFSDIVNLYTVRIAIFFGGSWAFFWGESFYRSNTLERTLLISPDCPEVGSGWGGWPCEQRRGGGGGGNLENGFSDDEPCFGRKLVGNIPQGFLIGLPLSFVNIRGDMFLFLLTMS